MGRRHSPESLLLPPIHLLTTSSGLDAVATNTNCTFSQLDFKTLHHTDHTTYVHYEIIVNQIASAQEILD
jgi:hypothetical protein